MGYFQIGSLLVASLLLPIGIQSTQAANFRYSGRLSPNDYLFGSQEQHGDSIFDNAKPIDLSASIGIGSDCGKINFEATLHSTITQLLDGKFYGDLGQKLLGSAPMLSMCYMSPTLCAIVKHSQLSANMLSQLRLNQCSIIDKYVDSRVEDYYRERQSCVHRAIGANGGDMDAAMNVCSDSDVASMKLSNWAGSRFGDKVGVNKLIESSAKWAGLNTAEAQGSLDLVKSFVGDTVLAQGSVSVEYGPKRVPMTPRTYLESVERTTYDKLCNRMLGKLDQAGSEVPIDQTVSDFDLKEINKDTAQPLIDRSTLRALAAMNPKQRSLACKKLSDATAMTLFSTDANRSLDVLTTLTQNPNLPAQRKQEIEDKRRALKEQIEMTVELQRQRSEPLNQVLAQIHEEGTRRQREQLGDSLDADSTAHRNRQVDLDWDDCSDGLCN